MKLFFLLALFGLNASAQATPAAELAFMGGAVHAVCSWEKGPSTPDENVIRVEWTNGKTREAVEAPGAFKVTLFMPDMGHGSAPTQLERVLDSAGNPLPGVYRVSSIYFTMDGDWLVRLSLKTGDGREETQSFPVKL